MIRVDCELCGEFFEVADTLAGGLANCPACGQAVQVPGLRDPMYRLVLIGMAIGWVVLTAIGWAVGGLQGAVIAGGGCAVVLGLVYVSM